MLAFIILFFPAAIMAVWKRRLFKEEYDGKDVLVEYIVDVVLINFLVIAIAYVFFGSRGSVVSNINTYMDYALEYTLLAMVLAVGMPIAAKWLKAWQMQRKKESRENTVNEINEQTEKNLKWGGKNLFRHLSAITGKFHVRYEKIFIAKPYYGRVCLYLYAIVLIVLNLTRCFDNVLWGDEAYTALYAMNQTSIIETLAGTAVDPYNPPLYYLWVWIIYLIFGSGAWHIASFCTYVIFLIVGITWFRKKFGSGSAALLISLATFLSSSETYIVEVRAYSMAALFVLLTFLALYEVIQQKTWKWYILFAVFSLGTAYTHYFALFTVAFFYAFLFVEAFQKKAEWKKILAACVITIVGYLPWLRACFLAMSKMVAEEFWITVVPTLKECLYYLFSGQAQQKMLALYIAVLIILVLSCCISLERQSKNQTVTVNIHRFMVNDFAKWIFVGQVAIIGTIGIGLGASVIIRPVLVLRYLFAASSIAWVTLAACVSRVRFGNVLAAVLAVAVVISYGPQYFAVYSQEKDYETEMQTILEATADMDSDAILATNISHLETAVLEYYYPENYIYGEDETADFEVLLSGACGDDVWVFWAEELNVSERTRLERSGYDVEAIYDGVFVGFYQTYIYHLTD